MTAIFISEICVGAIARDFASDRPFGARDSENAVTTAVIHLVLTYRADKRGKLKAETPLTFKTAAEAKARAERAEPRFAGVVAISQTYDVDTEEVDENPAVLFRAGRLPREFAEE